MVYSRYVAIGDSTTEGLEDPYPDGSGYRGWADRLAQRLAGENPELGYANLAVRGKLACQVREEQLARARARPLDRRGGTQRHAAPALRPRRDRGSPGRDDRRAVGHGGHGGDDGLPGSRCRASWPASRARGCLPSMSAFARSRRGTARWWSTSSATARPDRRLWHPDRLHANTDGHARIAEAFAEALGLPGAGRDWAQPLPPGGAVSRRRALADDEVGPRAPGALVDAASPWRLVRRRAPRQEAAARSGPPRSSSRLSPDGRRARPCRSAGVDQLERVGRPLEREASAHDRLDEAVRRQAVDLGTDLAIDLRLAQHVGPPAGPDDVDVVEQQPVDPHLGIEPPVKPTTTQRPRSPRERRLSVKRSPPTGSMTTSTPPPESSFALSLQGSSERSTSSAPASPATFAFSSVETTAIVRPPRPLATWRAALPTPPAPRGRARSRLRRAPARHEREVGGVVVEDEARPARSRDPRGRKVSHPAPRRPRQTRPARRRPPPCRPRSERSRRARSTPRRHLGAGHERQVRLHLVFATGLQNSGKDTPAA